MMGSGYDDKNHQDDEGPVHKVCLDAFWIGKCQVTQNQWSKIMGNNPSKFQKGDMYPVEMISWNDTQVFIAKINEKSGKKYRLPSEAEWEYACRAGDSKKYDLDASAWYAKNSDGSTHPVGEKEANAFGLHDMLGNVWEWCADKYGENYYASSPEKNPLGPLAGNNRVLRGGSWIDDPFDCRAVFRDRSEPSYRSMLFGFRLVLPVL
jgi:formylglycine-generating enzyme required for sulfatase activity